MTQNGPMAEPTAEERQELGRLALARDAAAFTVGYLGQNTEVRQYMGAQLGTDQHLSAGLLSVVHALAIELSVHTGEQVPDMLRRLSAQAELVRLRILNGDTD